ncbi:MAG: hypothetical protein AAF098_00895 [Pseudomonadota bacterium]
MPTSSKISSQWVWLGVALIAVLGLAWSVGPRLLLILLERGMDGIDMPHEFTVPEPTNWSPKGPRVVGEYTYSVLPQPDGFRTMHGTTLNSDNVWIAAAPMFEFDWVAETDMYIPEGPTYDNEGNLYFSPAFPREDVSLVSLDGETGHRRWAITGDGLNRGSGAPLILNDPDNPGTQIIYHAAYTNVMALHTDGTVIWKSPTGLSLPDVQLGQLPWSKSYAFNYLPQHDSLGAGDRRWACVCVFKSDWGIGRSYHQVAGSPGYQ